MDFTHNRRKLNTASDTLLIKLRRKEKHARRDFVSYQFNFHTQFKQTYLKEDGEKNYTTILLRFVIKKTKKTMNFKCESWNISEREEIKVISWFYQVKQKHIEKFTLI